MSSTFPLAQRIDHSQEIRAAQIRLLYEQAPAALIATIANSAILVAALWKQVPRWWLAGWFLASLFIVLARFLLRRSYFLARPVIADAIRWERRFLVGVATNGVLWGCAGYFFFLEDNYLYQLLLAFVLAGMVSGSIATLSPVRHAYSLFLFPALLPFLFRLVSVDNDVYPAMGAMLVLYIVMMAIISRRQYLTVVESLRLRFENLDLLDDLHRANVRQEGVNTELAAEIREKHRAQEALRGAYADLEQRVFERTAELERSEENLREANRQKDQFLAMLGHELRNPLAPIRNATEILNRPSADPARLAWCRDVIGRQVHHLTRLVDDLLDVSRISRGKIELKKESLAVAEIVQCAVETSRPLIDARRHQLSVQLPSEPQYVFGDRVRLAQLFSNLLNNAAKYTDEGGTIGVTVEPAANDVIIRIRDNGRGIDPEALSKLFDLFYQMDCTLDRSEGGLGIGLSIVRHLVAMHGGEVRAFSEGRGRGSEFLVRLPCLPVSAPTQESS